MVYALSATLVVQTLLFVALVLRMATYLVAERGVQQKHIAELLQRIQAPQDAVYTHSLAASDAAPSPQPLVMGLPYDDDEAFHETKEQLAERLVD